MSEFSRRLRDHLWPALFWLAAALMALALPVYAAATSLPIRNAVGDTIVAACPAPQMEKCMATADLIQAVGSFYDVVIIVLIALLAAVVSLVYLTIRASSKRQIEQQFEKDLEAPWFQHRLQQKADLASQIAIAEVIRRLEVLEDTVAKQNTDDKSEDLPGGQTVVLNGGPDHGAG